jgi:hypothetical protein
MPDARVKATLRGYTGIIGIVLSMVEQLII